MKFNSILYSLSLSYQVLPHTSTAISFLLEACNLYNNFQIPSTHLTLAKGYSGSTVSISLPSSLSTFSWKDLHAQVIHVLMILLTVSCV